jgi:hypothetical protein
MKRGHAERMNKVLLEITEAGPDIEDGILRVKELLKDGINPDLMRNALGIYLTHSPDAQKRKVAMPPLKDHALFLNNQYPVALTGSDSAELPVTPGEVTPLIISKVQLYSLTGEKTTTTMIIMSIGIWSSLGRDVSWMARTSRSSTDRANYSCTCIRRW